MNKIIIILFLLINIVPTFGQENFKEIKSLNKTMPFEKGNKIKIFGERTFVNIKVWDKNEVSANVEIVSRYKVKEQAQKDLEAIQLVLEKKGKVIYYSNAILINNPADKPKSNLKTVLNLSIPSYAVVDINNAFGEVTISGPIEKLTIDSKFCTNSISDYKGNLTMTSEYDNTQIINSDGAFKIDGNRTELSLNNVSGNIVADLKLGKLDLTYNDDLSTYKIDAKYTPISVFLIAGLTIYQNYTCEKCNIITTNCHEEVKEIFMSNKNNLTIGHKEKMKATSQISSASEDIKIISITNQAYNK